MSGEKQMQVTVLQMDVRIGEPAVNEARVMRALEAAVQGPGAGRRVLVLPEMWNTGYALERLDGIADVNGERTISLMSAFARQHHVWIVAGSVAVRLENGTYVNRSYVFDADGNVAAQYDKCHLFRLMDEEKFLTEGQQPCTFSLAGLDAGLMICYDIRFPEWSRRLALGGAQVLFVVAQWPNPRLHHWRTLLQARAIENQMYVVACNRVGVSGETSFFGHSLVIDPWGEVLVEGGDEEDVLRATLDLELVGKVRQRIPVFADRRPELY